MKTVYDVLGLGVTAVDDLLYVREYPPADTKLRVRARDRQGGGLTGTALIAAARLGASCAYAGMLGDDELSRFVVDTMHAEGVDTRHVLHRDDASPVHSTIVVDETHHTRTILYHVANASGAEATHPAEEVVRSTKVLFVDQYGIDGMIRAAKIAREAGAGVVADFEHSGDHPRFGELLALVDHLILPRDYARELSGRDDVADAVRKLFRGDLDTVCVTCGADGAYYVAKDAPTEVRHQPAFKVQTVDTTGCGDVFHGAYAFALSSGLAADERVQFASAVAALKATQPGGQKGIPPLSAVDAFLSERDQ